MNSRERIELAINHQEADRIPLDLGGSGQTGMHVTTVYGLRQALKLDPPGTAVKVVEPFQMLGEIKPDLQDALGVDVVGVGGKLNFFGFENKDWKPWEMLGVPVLVPGLFNTQEGENGDLFIYPQGDHTALPSGKMPKDGFYFDSLVRGEAFDEDNLNVEDNLEEFSLISDEEVAHLKMEVENAAAQSERAIVLGLSGMAYGDIALVPGPTLKNPKGIRDMTEWYMSTVSRKDYIYEVFDRQSQIALANLPKIYAAVGDKVTVAWISGTDFGAQNNCFISPKSFRSLYKPFYKRINDWIHQNTNWKTFIHSCGSILPIIPDIIESGFDILNPVQISAANMDPTVLKSRFGQQVTFWGGGVDTQSVLPFGSVEDVRTQVRENLKIFGQGGGFVFATVHNVQAKVPIENLLAMYETVRDYGNYH